MKEQSAPARVLGTATPSGGTIDTAFLLEDLKRKYADSGEPLSVSFRELASWVRAGDQLTHQVHPYPAKLLPHIANFFVRASTLCRSEDKVLDPFCGSGTVALETSLAGATPLVSDANPFALLVAKVKTTPYRTAELIEIARKLRARILRLRVAPNISVVNEHLWYSPGTKRNLEIVMRAIMEIENEEARDFFRVCFSSVSRRLSYADPAVNVPVRLKEKGTLSDAANEKVRNHLRWLSTASVADEFDRVVQINIGRVHAANLMAPTRRQALCVGTDARKLKIGNGRGKGLVGSIPLTITSPPYGSAQKYIRATSLALNWLSLCQPSELAGLEGQSIGREHLSSKRKAQSLQAVRQFTAKFENLLEQIKKSNVVRESITRTYLLEMSEALSEIYRVTCSGGHAVVIVGNNTVAGFNVENDLFVTETMTNLGFSLELSMIDRIHSRGLMTARNKSASPIVGETILLFRKQ